MKNKRLFEEFPSVTTEEWERKIQEDLKGASYDKKLIWKTPEGFAIRPYYRSEDLKDKEYLNSLPGETPFIRGNRKSSNTWQIRQDVVVNDLVSANQKALSVLENGVDSVGFIPDQGNGKLSIDKPEDISQLLQGIQLESVPVHFICGKHGIEILNYLVGEGEKRKLKNISGSLDFDPLGYLTISGEYYSNEKEDKQSLIDLVHFAEKHNPGYKVLAVNGHYFNAAGATVVQELGYSLAIASEYLSITKEAGISSDTVCRQLHFNLGVGSNYFMEIAKIRAARLLWNKLAEAWQAKEESSKQVFIHSISSEWNQTLYDPYVNVLRATTEAMSAIVGSADSLIVKPFTSPYKPATDLSDRIAKNIQIIIREEAYLGKVIDPSAGSYFIENLTDSIITETWKLFLQVEEQGGYLAALKKGFIQNDIKNSSEKRRDSVSSGKEVLLGTNQFPNADEVIKDEVDNEVAFPGSKSPQSVVEPIQLSRGSVGIEKLRLATENRKEGRPKVFLLTMGDPFMRRARATFSGNFFTCGGYEIIDNPGFSSSEEGISAVIKSKAEIVVICSSDEEYEHLVPKVNDLLSNRALLVVAGAPACMEELKAKGIKDFIHIRSNIVESLSQFHHKLGIKLQSDV